MPADREMLKLWTVYDRPKDYPEHYVARLSVIGGGEVTMTAHRMLSSDLNDIRARLLAMGLAPMARHPDDDPVIVEVWL